MTTFDSIECTGPCCRPDEAHLLDLVSQFLLWCDRERGLSVTVRRRLGDDPPTDWDGDLWDSWSEDSACCRSGSRYARAPTRSIPIDPAQQALERLETAVGGADALARLDTSPLPDEAFDWSGIDPGVRQPVEAQLALCDEVATDLFDVEHRTAIRRTLARAAVNDPSIWRREVTTATGAAAVTWVVARANESVGPTKRLLVRELLARFGLAGTVAAHGHRVRAAVNPWRASQAWHYDGSATTTFALGDPALLVAARRREIARERDSLTARADGATCDSRAFEPGGA